MTEQLTEVEHEPCTVIQGEIPDWLEGKIFPVNLNSLLIVSFNSNRDFFPNFCPKTCKIKKDGIRFLFFDAISFAVKQNEKIKFRLRFEISITKDYKTMRKIYV